jgi:hypothetical protein
MEHTSSDHDGFVLKPGPLRIILASVIFVICAAVFLFMAATLIMIEVDSLLARFALLLGRWFWWGLPSFSCCSCARTSSASK